MGYDVKLAPVRDNVRIYGAGAYLGGSAACSARSVARGVRGGLTRKNACVVLRNAVYQLHSLGVGSLGIRNSGSRAALDDLGNRLCGGLFADKLLACQLAVYVLFLDGVYALAVNSGGDNILCAYGEVAVVGVFRVVSDIRSAFAGDVLNAGHGDVHVLVSTVGEFAGKLVVFTESDPCLLKDVRNGSFYHRNCLCFSVSGDIHVKRAINGDVGGVAADFLVGHLVVAAELVVAELQYSVNIGFRRHEFSCNAVIRNVDPILEVDRTGHNCHHKYRGCEHSRLDEPASEIQLVHLGVYHLWFHSCLLSSYSCPPGNLPVSGRCRNAGVTSVQRQALGKALS